MSGRIRQGLARRRQAQLLSRKRLLDQHVAALLHTITPMAAPAGAGKASLLVDWAAAVGARASNCPMQCIGRGPPAQPR